MRAHASRPTLSGVVRATRVALVGARIGVVAATALLGVGCVASIEELRLPGPEHPTADSRSEVTRETRDGASLMSATIEGTRIDVGVVRTVECRDVRVTESMVRDVEIRRSFADDAQERDVVMSLLLVAGIGLLAYAANQPTCPPAQGGCSLGATTAAEIALGGGLAVPLGFIAYNASRARDGLVVEPEAPRVERGPWSGCSLLPMAGERVEIAVGDLVRTGETGPDGHVIVAVGAGPDGSGPIGAPKAVVRHAGSADLEVTLAPPGGRPAVEEGSAHGEPAGPGPVRHPDKP